MPEGCHGSCFHRISIQVFSQHSNSCNCTSDVEMLYWIKSSRWQNPGSLLDVGDKGSIFTMETESEKTHKNSRLKVIVFSRITKAFCSWNISWKRRMWISTPTSIHRSNSLRPLKLNIQDHSCSQHVLLLCWQSRPYSKISYGLCSVTQPTHWILSRVIFICFSGLKKWLEGQATTLIPT